MVFTSFIFYGYFRCTSFYGTPTMFVDLLTSLKNVNDVDITSLRTGSMGGSSCPEQLVTDVIHSLHCKEILVCLFLWFGSRCPCFVIIIMHIIVHQNAYHHAL